MTSNYYISFMSEKSKQPSKLLSYLITVSIFVLILSSVFLLQSTGSSLMSKSVYSFILVNNSSLVHFKPNRNSLNNKSRNNSCLPSRISNISNPNNSLLKVFMYDLPPEFHFGLLGWKGEGYRVWPNISNLGRIPSYPGGLNLQHSIEYWLTLDLLSSNPLGVVRPCCAVRVSNSSLADVIFVPFFSSLSYNRHSNKLHRRKDKVSMDRILQDRLIEFLMSQDEWKRKGGKDHIIVAHHPNSMLSARKKLGSAMFVLADFGRYPVGIANIEKDIIAPYKHVVRTIGVDESAPYEKRPILAYFQGAIYRKDGGVIRQELYYLLKDEKDVHFMFGTVRGNGIHQASKGMADSKFCLNIAGDTPSSNRLFDAIVSHCVPVIISDEIELPFEDVLDYSEFCIFVRSSDAIKKGYLVNLLRKIRPENWTKMWKRLKEVAPHFEYRYPSLPGDAVEMIWGAIARKVHSAQFRLKENRFRRYKIMRKTSTI